MDLARDAGPLAAFFVAIVFVDGIDQAALLADETPRAAGEVYNITDGENTTLRDFVGFIAEYLELPQPTKHLLAPAARAATGVFESIARATRSTSAPLMNKSRLRFLHYNQRYSIDKARRELGYVPQFSYREGLPPAAWPAANRSCWAAAIRPSVGTRCSSMRSAVRPAASAPAMKTSIRSADALIRRPATQPARPKPPSVTRATIPITRRSPQVNCASETSPRT